MANYFIGVGGTGARCAEACVYLASAGIIRDDLRLLVIDPDANNGNASAAESLLTYYYLIHQERQPLDPQFSRAFKILSTILPARAPVPALFQSDINNGGVFPTLWNMQQRNDRRFFDVIEYASSPTKLKSFIDLFYHADDMNMPLEVGYQGRTNVGAVALKQDLEVTRNTAGSGLCEFLAALTGDLQNGEGRVFVVGSVFGGTGAAGIPTIPALLKGLDDEALPAAQRANLRWGCALMAPYFIFPRNTAGGEKRGPGTDSARHPVATQAALLHYAHTPPGYQHVYLLGSPYRGKTNEGNFPGGYEQRNLPHYVELAAALAAWDFYTLPGIHGEERKLHYADSYDNGRDAGVNWGTLPVGLADSSFRRAEVKQKLIAFTTFAYLYRNILHNEFISNRTYLQSDMYKDNFGNLSLEGFAQEQSLVALNGLCDNYLQWLRGIGETGGSAPPSLFNWDALAARDLRDCERRVGNLVSLGTQEAQRPPRYGNNGYQKIMEKLNQTKLHAAQTQSAVGLFIYLLHTAVTEFCKENYDWR